VLGMLPLKYVLSTRLIHNFLLLFVLIAEAGGAMVAGAALGASGAGIVTAATGAVRLEGSPISTATHGRSFCEWRSFSIQAPDENLYVRHQWSVRGKPLGAALHQTQSSFQ